MENITVRTLVDQLMIDLRLALMDKVEPICSKKWGRDWELKILPKYIANENGKLPSSEPLKDPLQVFKLIRNAWFDIFNSAWEGNVRAHVQKFYSLRNDWAHHSPIDQRDLEDALHRAGIIMGEIGDRNRQAIFEKALDSLKNSGSDNLFEDSAPATAEVVNKLDQGEAENPTLVNKVKGNVWTMLDPRQRALIRQRNKSGYRRIRGSAGSGKTIVLTARAVEIASIEGSRVLILAFNRTMVGYLKGLVKEYARMTEQEEAINRIECCHFHGWCISLHDKFKVSRPMPPPRGCSSWDEYNDQLVKGAVNIIESKLGSGFLPYDAIVVDEGQDFHLSWWQILRKALVQGEGEKGWTKGEMMLVADASQDLYGTASAWTDEAMQGAGFRGPWFELEASYRMPPELVPLLKQFMEDHLPQSLPLNRPVKSKAKPEDFPFVWNWHNEPADPIDKLVSEVKRLYDRERELVVQVPSRRGREVVDAFAKCGIVAKHIFDRNGVNTKDGFRLAPGEVGVITPHSFKGFEAPLNVVWIDSFYRVEQRHAAYVAISRVKRHVSGSELVVINQTPELAHEGDKWEGFTNNRNNTMNSSFF